MRDQINTYRELWEGINQAINQGFPIKPHEQNAMANVRRFLFESSLVDELFTGQELNYRDRGAIDANLKWVQGTIRDLIQKYDL